MDLIGMEVTLYGDKTSIEMKIEVETKFEWAYCWNSYSPISIDHFTK